MKKIIFMFCSLLPLCLQIPYLLSAWRFSRLDQWDALFYLLAVPAAAYAVRKAEISHWDRRALFPAVPLLLLALGTPWHQTHALAIAASVFFIFTAVWLAASWSFAYRLLPAILILLLGTPSSSYALSCLLMCPVWAAWAVKFLLSALCILWIFCNERFGLQLKTGTLCFGAAFLCSAFLLLHSRELYFEGAPFIPEFSIHEGDFWGRSIEPDDNTKRFFASSTVKQFRYSRNDADISVLAVKCGGNIHEIHPASHCLRTSFWSIRSEKTFYLQDDFAVTEIEAVKGASHFLMWVWYSSDNLSTPGFLGFRRHFRSGGNYHTYQISTPIYGDIDRSRNELRQFMQVLKSGRGSDQL